MLRSRVSRNVRRTNFTCDRCNIDDASPTALDHFGQRRTGAAKCASEIYVEVTFPHRFVASNEQLAFSDAGIIHQDVRSATEMPTKAIERPCYASCVRDVAFKGEGRHAKLIVQFICYFLNLLGSACRYRHGTAFASEDSGDAATNTATTAGDQCESVF